MVLDPMVSVDSWEPLRRSSTVACVAIAAESEERVFDWTILLTHRKKNRAHGKEGHKDFTGQKGDTEISASSRLLSS